MNGMRVVLLLFALWLVAQAGSYWATSGITGPRNIDTGFKKLDVLFKWQLVALSIAIVAAISGFVGEDRRWRKRLTGLAPAILTFIFVGGVVTFAISRDQESPEVSPGPATVTPDTMSPAAEDL